MLKLNLVDSQTQQELLKWYGVITRQNYFTNNENIILLHDGLAMSTPSSSVIAEILLQHRKHAFSTPNT